MRSRNNHYWERPLVAMGCDFYNVTYGSGVARRERRKRSNPRALSHAARAIIPRRNKIKPESRRALTLPISEDSTPTHPVPSSSIVRPTSPPSLFLLSVARNGPKLDRCPVLSISIPLPSRENAPGSRTGPEDANQIYGEGREKSMN